MEFDLEQLRRDWIDGISGEEFCARVQDRCVQFGEATCAVVIVEKEPVHFAVEFFAAISTGLPIVLTNPNWGASEWQQFKMLMSAAYQFEEVGVPPLGGAFEKKDRLKAGLQPINAGSILIPTGGSTGGVKLATHTWGSLAAACRGVQDFLGGGAVDSCCVLPLYHVSGLMQLLRAYHSGGYIRFDEDEVAGACLSYVPTQLRRSLADPARIQKITTARAIFVGGAALPEALAAQARELKLPVVPVYGMTETAAMCAAVPAEDFLADASAGAQPIGDASFEIESGGRIRIQSAALFKGYYGRPPTDLSRGYLSDDEGRLDRDGRLHVIGRVDRLINSGGEKIDPREVEAAVAALDGVEEVLAVGLPDSEWGQKLVVYYTGSEVQDWKARLSGRLVNYKLPKVCVWVEELPLDEKGKFVGEIVGERLVTPASGQSGGCSAGVTSRAPTVEASGDAGGCSAGVTSRAPTVEASDQSGGCSAGVTSRAPTVEASGDVGGFSAGVTSRAPTIKKLAIRKTHHLYKGRVSIPGARYFITLCSKGRVPSLLDSALAQSILDTWRLQHTDGDYTFHCGSSMPDHIHFLFTLGSRISLGQCIIKFKAKTKEAMDAAGLSWQRDFYDHRLRADDAMEGFAKYTFLNPYRKSLLPLQEPWAHWHLSRDYTPDFLQYLVALGAPPKLWIEDSLGVEELIKNDLEA